MSAPDGLLVVDKPSGWTSHDVVGRCRRLARTKKVGHAGTLDDELALLVVHGVLHVLGHDHASDAERARMQARERELLERHHSLGQVLLVLSRDAEWE